ncbi:MAG: outer membrane protein assembly factor BamB family protein [Candidatus Cyclobacteriaceae bacterium M2_1C_046]
MRVLGIVIITLCANILCAQQLKEAWRFETGSKIIAAAVVDEENIYMGNTAGNFYAIERETGKKKWSFQTPGKIQSKALIINDMVFFESGHSYYALDKSDGSLIWDKVIDDAPEKYTSKEKEILYELDPFDDKHSSPSLYRNVIYVGTGTGKVLGLDPGSGEVILEINTEGNAPVRSTPFIENDVLYFGDWNGLLYAYSLTTNENLWKRSTYRKKPYATFGGLASEFVSYKGNLIFGARNPMLNVVRLENGEKEWTYTDPIGSWIIGDPVIYNDTLYIAGSDNFSIFAFNPYDGRLIWQNIREKNIYSKPVVTDKLVIFTSGESYNPEGSGELVVLNRKNGELITHVEIPKGSFASPVMKDNFLYFGSNEGVFYCLKL